MSHSIPNLWKVFKQTVRKFIGGDPMVYSSSIAFYTIFSLPAILMIAISIAGSAFETQVVLDNLMQQIQQLFGRESANIVEKVLANNEGIGTTLFGRIVGISTLAFSATTVFVSLQNGLNNIWGVKVKPKQGFIKFIIYRLVSLAMVMSIGFLLLVSLIIDTFISLFGDLLSNWFSQGTYYIVFAMNLFISLFIVTAVFALIFKVLPDVKIKWGDVWFGAVLSTILFIIGKFLIGYYLGNSDLGTIYGAAGSLVLLLIWVYYSSTILLFGAIFTFVYSKSIGHNAEPESYAEKDSGVREEGAIKAKGNCED